MMPAMRWSSPLPTKKRGADMREVKLAVTLLEVSIGRMAERLEKIEKRLGMLTADRLESATV